MKVQMVEVETMAGNIFRGALIDTIGGIRLSIDGHSNVKFVPNFRLVNVHYF